MEEAKLSKGVKTGNIDQVYGRFSENIVRDITTFGGTPLFLGLILFAYLLGSSYFDLGFDLLVGFILTIGICVVVRIFYFKNRPKKINNSSFIGKMDASSFPSVHSSRVFFLAPLFASFFGIVSVWAMMYVLAVLVAWSRLELKKHDLWDVGVGAIVGTVSWILVVNFF